MSKDNRKGFTLVELLVVIAIIGVLIAILLPALSKARRAALVTKCAANLHNNGGALLNYAAAFKGSFPQGFGQGNWPWDLSIAARDLMVRYGTTRNAMYCPSYPDQNSDDVWNFAAKGFQTGTGVRTKPENQVTHNVNDGADDFGAMGYFVMLTRAGLPKPPATTAYIYPIGDPRSINYNSQAAKFENDAGVPVVFHDRLGSRNSAMLELMSDATLSSSLPNDSKNTFALVQGGSVYTRHSTAHLARNGQEPEGGNVLFMDGHVAWRPYSRESNPNNWTLLKYQTMRDRRGHNLLAPWGGGGSDPNGRNLYFWW